MSGRIQRKVAIIAATTASIVVFSMAGTAGENNWTTLGPYGGRTDQVLFDPGNPSVAYTLAYPGLYKSTDAGKTWTVLNLDASSPPTNIAIDRARPGRLYAASIGGLFRSNDYGASFERLAVPFNDNTRTNAVGPISVSVSDSGMTVFVVMQDSSTYFSTDAGQTFTARGPGKTFSDILIHPANESAFYASGPGGLGVVNDELFTSTDAGASWASRTIPFPGGGLALTTVGTTTLWRSAFDGIRNSTDGGVTWNLSLSLTPPPASPWIGWPWLSRDSNVPNVLHVGPRESPGRVYRYSAGAWQQLAGVLPRQGYRITQAAPGSNTMLASTVVGIYRSDDDGASWVRSDSGLTGWPVSGVSASKSRIFAGQSAGELASATGAGAWTRAQLPSPGDSTPSDVRSLAADPTDPDIVLAGTYGVGMYRSSDGGATWTSVASSSGAIDGYVHAIAFDPNNPLIVYATQIKNDAVTVMRSIDHGRSFDVVSENLPPLKYVNALVVDPRKLGHVLLSGGVYGQPQVSGVFRSTDGGSRWTQVVDGGGGSDVTFDAVTADRVYASNGTTGSVAVSNDGGASWAPLTTFDMSTLGYPYDIEADPQRGGTLYVAAVRFGPPINFYRVLRSVDSGLTWELLTAPTISHWHPLKIVLAPDQPSIVHISSDSGSMYNFEVAPDLAVSVEGHSGQKIVSSASALTARIENKASLSATDVVVTITLPASLQSVSASVPNGQCSVQSNVARCSVPFVHGGASVLATVSYTPTVAGAIDVSASVSARERDPQAANNASTATATAGAAPPATSNGGGGGGGGGGGAISLLLALLLAPLRLLQIRRGRRLGFAHR